MLREANQSTTIAQLPQDPTEHISINLEPPPHGVKLELSFNEEMEEQMDPSLPTYQEALAMEIFEKANHI